MPPATPDDYYALLGVDPRADASELRRAWRRLALQWHPDRAGPQATDTFRRIAEAYEVLSDPLARAAYDRGRPAPPPAPRAPTAPPAPAPLRRAPAVQLSRLTGPLDALIACGVARRAEAGVIELFPNAAEVAQGGFVTIAMRVDVRCPGCAGGASAGGCDACKGAGVTRELFSAWLTLPPGVADGAVLAPSAELRGALSPTRFRVRLTRRA